MAVWVEQVLVLSPQPSSSPGSKSQHKKSPCMNVDSASQMALPTLFTYSALQLHISMIQPQKDRPKEETQADPGSELRAFEQGAL